MKEVVGAWSSLTPEQKKKWQNADRDPAVAYELGRHEIRSGLKLERNKIRECGAYIYAGCGELECVMAIAEWLKRGAPFGECKLDEGGGWGLAVRTTDGKCFHVQGKQVVLADQTEGFAADGSGRDLALSAMAFGKTATEAIEFAARFDVNTGEGYDGWVWAPPTEDDGASRRIHVHDHEGPRARCELPAICACECTECERAWWAAARPNPRADP